MACVGNPEGKDLFSSPKVYSHLLSYLLPCHFWKSLTQCLCTTLSCSHPKSSPVDHGWMSPTWTITPFPSEHSCIDIPQPLELHNLYKNYSHGFQVCHYSRNKIPMLQKFECFTWNLSRWLIHGLHYPQRKPLLENYSWIKHAQFRSNKKKKKENPRNNMRNTSQAVLHKLFLLTGWIRLEHLVFSPFLFSHPKCPSAPPWRTGLTCPAPSGACPCPLTLSPSCAHRRAHCAVFPGAQWQNHPLISQMVLPAGSEEGSSDCWPAVSPELTPAHRCSPIPWHSRPGPLVAANK